MIGKIVFVGKRKMVVESNWRSYWINLREDHGFVASDKMRRIHCRELWTLTNSEISRELYGFSSLREADWFGDLVACKKIGPRTAMRILKHDINEVKRLIISQDVTKIASLAGLNKQIAAALIAHDWKPWQLNVQDQTTTPNETNKNPQHNANQDEVIETLTLLGYDENAIKACIDKVKVEPEADVADVVSEIIKYMAQQTQNEQRQA